MTGQRVFGLDALRALAVSLVLLAHCSFLFVPCMGVEPLRAWLMLGHLGVELFFVLSGYLIGGILLDEARPEAGWVGGFWRRRWLRTLPNYYLFLALNLCIERWVSGHWPMAWSYVVFAQNLAWPQPPFFIEAWSLAVEEIFYLCAPLVAIAALRWIKAEWRMPALIALILGLSAVRWCYVAANDPSWDEGVRKISAVRLDAIAYGVLMVMADRRGYFAGAKAWLTAISGALLLAAAITAYLTLDLDHSTFARTALFNLVSLGFVAWLPAAARCFVRDGNAWWARSVGRMAAWSYALYLTQLAVLRVLVLGLGWRAADITTALTQALAFATFAIALAALVYRVYERPWLRLRERWQPRTLRPTH
jgi:peptidoglycan/LPS O-acetylase OafA/YrhL